MDSASARKLLVGAIMLCCIPSAHTQAVPDASQQGVLTVDLKSALERARTNSPRLQSASIGIELAREDRRLAKFGFYPSASYLNQYIYTQGNGTPSGVFVSNDGVHVYNSQAVVHQELYSPARRSEFQQADIMEAIAEARKEIVTRGLDATVVQ